jgi:Predicted membrane protein (DUF2207)
MWADGGARKRRNGEPGRTGTLAAGVAAVVLALAWLAAPAAASTSVAHAPASAAADGERIATYATTYDIHSDGTIDVTEEITYDFGANERHGIERRIPVREPADPDSDRVYHIDEIEVASPSGAPANLHTEDNGFQSYIRIGDPDRTITGQQTYQIRYRLVGALNVQPELDELYWDAIGSAWAVPIGRATVTVTAPAGIKRVTCFSGDLGSTEVCAESGIDSPRRARFAQSDLGSGQPLTIVVGLAKGTVTVPPPELVDTAYDSGFGGSGPDLVDVPLSRPPDVTSYGVAGAFLVGSVALAGLGYWRRGRDQQYLTLPYGMVPPAGQPLDHVPVGPVRRGVAIAPEFRPPDGVPAGVAGTLLDEEADTLDVSATIVDLAVRRHLHIEELAPKHFWNNRDWQLTRLAAPGDQLIPAEAALMEALFENGREQVLMSELKYKFATHLGKVKGLLYDEVVRRGWFHRRPDRIRTLWRIAGTVIAIGGGAFAANAFFSSQRYDFAVMGIGGLLAGIVLRVSSKAMPSRSPAGSAMLARVLGFRRYLETAEAEQLRFEEGEDVFSRYLPYAMVFDVTERWARVFATLAATGAATTAGVYWYSGPDGFSAEHLGHSLTNFADTTSSTMSATRSSAGGGSGFSGGSSGGGGGGGGGGSW